MYATRNRKITDHIEADAPAYRPRVASVIGSARSFLTGPLVAVVLTGALSACFGSAQVEGYDEAVAAYNRGKFSDAMEEFKTLDQQDHPGAQNKIGLMFANGEGVDLDEVEAMKWFRKAAAGGSPVAMYNLGLIHDNGMLGITENDEEAVQWYRKAAALGYVDASRHLGLRLSGAEPDQQQVDLSNVTIIDPAQQDDDSNNAIVVESEADDTGDAEAHYQLALNYDNGYGVARNKKKAAEWYRKAAVLGHAGAQHALGNMYFTGRGIGVNDAEAARWYGMAAEQRHTQAQHKLGLMYFTGQGIPFKYPDSYIRAYMWLFLADIGDGISIAGPRVAKDLGTVHDILSAAQIAEAKKRAAKYR